VEKTNQSIHESNKLPFLDHLEELRYRIFWIVISFFLFTAIAYFFKDYIFHILIAPLDNLGDEVKLIHLKVYDKFMAYLKISFYSGIVVSFPMIIYQFSRFVIPALYATEQKWYYVSLMIVIILFFGGAFLSFRYLAPTSVAFLIEFDKADKNENKLPNKPVLSSDKQMKSQLLGINNLLNTTNQQLKVILQKDLATPTAIIKIDQKLLKIHEDFVKLIENINGENDANQSHKIESYLSISDYLDWIIFFVFVIGLVFQLPLIIALLAKMGIVTDHTLAKIRPFALVIILVIAAIITPPDLLTQVMVGIPVYLLYEVSILIAVIIRKQKEKAAQKKLEE